MSIEVLTIISILVTVSSIAISLIQMFGDKE